MHNIIKFTPVELIFVDAAYLSEVAAERGLPRAENIAHNAIEDIAERLASAEAAWSAGEFARLSKVGKSLATVCEQIGMETFARAARQLAEAATGPDDIAIAATVARTLRVGEASLTAIWDIRHLRL